MLNYKHPVAHPETVPSATVPIYAILGPVLVLLGLGMYLRINRDHIHSALQGLLGAIALTLMLTEATKNYVGRPRPDFYYRCFPDGVLKMIDDTHPDCSQGRGVNDGRKSFFSGHASLSAAGLTYLTFFLALLLRTYHAWRRETLKGSLLPLNLLESSVERAPFVVVLLEAPLLTLVVSLLPSLGAMFVAASRVRDYRHHTSDVVVGYAVGLVVSYLCFRLYFPPPLDLIPSTTERGASSGNGGGMGVGMPSPSRRDLRAGEGGDVAAPADFISISTGPTSASTALRGGAKVQPAGGSTSGGGPGAMTMVGGISRAGDEAV